MRRKPQIEIDTDKIVIEKNIEKPVYSKNNGGGRLNKWYFIFTKMNINDSFALPYNDEDECIRLRNNITGAYRNYQKKHYPNFKLTTRVLFIKKEFRIWRDK